MKHKSLFYLSKTRDILPTLLWVALICLLLPGLYVKPAMAGISNPDLVLKLNGVHKMIAGDDSRWSALDFDDSSWDRAYLPANFNLLDAFRPVGVVWFRIHFKMPDELKNMDAGIYLGRIGDADVTYLNGIKIGQTGTPTVNFVEAANIYRLYKIPAGVLREDGENVLAVRAMHVQSYWGFFDNEIKIGEYALLQLETTKKTYRIGIFESCFLTGLLLVLVGCSFLYVHGTRDREYIYLWLFVATYIVFFVLDSSTFYLTGIQTPFMQRLVFSFLSLSSVFLSMFLVYATRSGVTPVLKALVSTLIALSILHLIPFPYAGIGMLSLLRMFVFIFSAVYLIYISVRAYLQKKHESGIILTGVIFYYTGSRVELLSGITLQKYSGLFLIDYAISFFLICMVYAMSARFARINKSLKLTSDKVLNAHEEERKRIARDIHDTLGQGLLAIKLNIQMLRSRIIEKREDIAAGIDNLVSEISSNIDEVRRIAADLRPSFIDNMELSESLLWHAENFKKRTGVSITITAGSLPLLPEKIKDNLYRIYQESVNNAIKHGAADTIDVLLSAKGNLLKMRIADNGTGFDASSEHIFQKGIGLESIKERAQLIGGSCNIESSGKGAIITVEVMAK